MNPEKKRNRMQKPFRGAVDLSKKPSGRQKKTPEEKERQKRTRALQKEIF